MKPKPNPNDPPNLAVIDLAIEIIKEGHPTRYTCHAIEAAVLAVEFRVSWRHPSYFDNTCFTQPTLTMEGKP